MTSKEATSKEARDFVHLEPCDIVVSIDMIMDHSMKLGVVTKVRGDGTYQVLFEGETRVCWGFKLLKFPKVSLADYAKEKLEPPTGEEVLVPGPYKDRHVPVGSLEKKYAYHLTLKRCDVGGAEGVCACDQDCCGPIQTKCNKCGQRYLDPAERGWWLTCR
jgi:hypothetical protein